MKTISNKNLVENFYTIIKKINPDFFIEVGAYQAEASIFVSNLLPECKVIAYEANPFNYRYFKDKFSKYNFQYINEAVANFVGDTTMYLQIKGKSDKKFVRGNNSLLKRTEENVKYKTEIVKCNKLDNTFNDPSKKYVLWIDAEGKGFEVLQGAEKLLDNVQAIFIEVESYKFWDNQILDNDIINYLESKQFIAYMKDQEYENQYNLIFIKKDVTDY